MKSKNKIRMCQEDALEDEEVEKIIDACKSEKEKFTIITLIYTGMRASEFCNMNKDWIKWQKRVIHVPSQEGDWTPKTSAGVRNIPILDVRLETILKRWFTLYDEVGLNRVTVFRIVKRVAERTDIQKKVYPHSLRATFATILAFKGLSESAIKYIMGWSQIKTAQNYVNSSGARAVEEAKQKWNQ